MKYFRIIPKIVFVSEQTFSKSLVDLYYEVGYAFDYGMEQCIFFKIKK